MSKQPDSKADKGKKQVWPQIRHVCHKNGSWAWLVDARINGKGERHFFKTKTEAETKATQLRVQRKNEGRGSINISEKVRLEALECAELLAPFGKSLRDAVDFYLPQLQATNRTCSLSCLFEELIDFKRKDGASKRYIGDLHSRLGRFAASMENKHVAEITATEVDEWLRALDVGPTSRNNTRRVLIVAFNFALARGYCVTNPVVKSAKAKEIEGIVGILTVEETRKLLDVSAAPLRAFIAIGAFAGLRSAELSRLDWSEVDLEGGLIQVTAQKAKSARRRFVKIRPNLSKWLKPIAKTTGFVSPSNLRKVLEAARKAAEIKEWPANALRHGFASYSLAHFNDAAALALELGHTNANLVFQHYRQVVKPAEAAKYWEIMPRTPEEDVVAFK